MLFDKLISRKTGFAVLSLLCFSTKSSALEFKVGDLDASLNTKLALSAGWRVDNRDRRILGQANQNLAPGSTIGSPTTNTDDGNWNFDSSETYSKRIKGATSLKLAAEQVGLVSSARYFYDFELKDESRAKDDTGFSRQLNDQSLDNAGADIELMDAYIYGDFHLGRPTSFKLGRHVLSWGEGLFMPGGINSINPVDVFAAREPGAELKDILLPVNMFSGSIGLTGALSLEAFYQLEWEAVQLDPCGTYFSSNDTIAEGCGPIVLLEVSDADSAALVAANVGIIPRIRDREASDRGQFGIALRWYLDQLNGIELGAYFLNYHSRLPYFSGAVLDPFQTTPTALLPIPGLPSYYAEYPEDIRLYGLSFSTGTDSGYSLAGEYSLRENLPIQWNSTEIIYGGLLRLHSRHLLQRAEEADSTPLELAGSAQKGYDRYKVSQLQFSSTKLINDVFDANQATLAAEVGAVYVHGLPDRNDARYGRAAHFGNGNFDGLGQEVFPDINPFSPLNPSAYSCNGENAAVAVNSNPGYCDGQGYTTRFSWGYILAMQLDYQAVFSGVNIQPEFYFSHDVNGTAPDPMGLFVEGRKSLGLTLKADYLLNRYQGALGFVRYYGGGRNNVLNDRDHLTASVSVSF